jgi:hypothetical protein
VPRLPPPEPPYRSEARVRAWDIILIGVEMVVFAWIAGLVAFYGFFAGAVVLECAPACDDAAIDAGTVIAVIGPVVVAVLAIGLTTWRLVRRKKAWWIPLAALPVLTVPFIVGNLVASTANL